VARNRLIVGLITPHLIYLTIMKPEREAKARSRAMLCMYVTSSDYELRDPENHCVASYPDRRHIALYTEDRTESRRTLIRCS
jgi:hypothetical protein